MSLRSQSQSSSYPSKLFFSYIVSKTHIYLTGGRGYLKMVPGSFQDHVRQYIIDVCDQNIDHVINNLNFNKCIKLLQ